MSQKCSIKNNKLIFDFELKDGEYILICNNQDYFSLYSREQFETIIEKLNIASEKENGNPAKTYIRHLYSRAEIVNIQKNCFSIPENILPYISLCEYEVEQKENFYRICRDKSMQCINDYYYENLVSILLD